MAFCEHFVRCSADAAHPSVFQSFVDGVSGLCTAARRVFTSTRRPSSSTTDADRPSYAPPIPRKRKASEVIDDEPPEQSFFSEEEEDAGRTGDGTMASMYSGRRTRSSAGLEGMLGVGKPKRPEWEIDRRLPDEVYVRLTDININS